MADLLSHVKPKDPQYLAVYGRATGGVDKRRRPSKKMREAILARQDGRCMYCGNKFGWVVRKGNRLVTLRLNWDHFVPYAFCGNNPADNWIAACHVCNGIKGATMFASVVEAQLFIRARWVEKGLDIVAFRPY